MSAASHFHELLRGAAWPDLVPQLLLVDQRLVLPIGLARDLAPVDPVPFDRGQLGVPPPHCSHEDHRRTAQASASFARRSWGDAYAQFATADTATPLDLDDLEKLALAAYLTGRDEESTLAWTRAHHEAIRRNDPQRAARHAVLVGSDVPRRDRTGDGMVRTR